MDPISAMLGIVGVGLSAYGAYENYEGGKVKAKAAGEEAALSEQELNLERNNISLQYQRNQRATIRSAVMQRAQAKAAAVGSGAQFGSAAAGAQAGITSAATSSQVNASQNFQLSNQEVDLKMAGIGPALLMGKGEEDQSIGAGLTSLGNQVVGNMGNINKIGQQFGSYFNQPVTA